MFNRRTVYLVETRPRMTGVQLVATLIGILALIAALPHLVAAAFSQPIERPSVNLVDPASVGPIRPLPAWFANQDTTVLRFETIYDLDRAGMRPVPATVADTCR